MRDARPPWASKFFRFHAVFGKIWRVHAPPGGFTPPPRENPGSATGIHYIPHTILQFYVIKLIKIKSNDTEIKSIKTYKSNKSKQNHTSSIPYFLMKILAKTFFRKKSVAKYIISQVIKPLLVLATIRFIHFSEGHLAKTLPTHCTV